MRVSLNNSLTKYTIVGGVGFLVDGGILYLLSAIGINSLAARTASIFIALIVTWYIHRNFTFKIDAPPTLRELLKYFASNAVGASVNYLTYCSLLLFFLKDHILVALAISSILALAVNYAGAKYIVFRKESLRKNGAVQ